MLGELDFIIHSDCRSLYNRDNVAVRKTTNRTTYIHDGGVVMSRDALVRFVTRGILQHNVYLLRQMEPDCEIDIDPSTFMSSITYRCAKTGARVSPPAWACAPSVTTPNKDRAAARAKLDKLTEARARFIPSIASRGMHKGTNGRVGRPMGVRRLSRLVGSIIGGEAGPPAVIDVNHKPEASTTGNTQESPREWAAAVVSKTGLPSVKEVAPSRKRNLAYVLIPPAPSSLKKAKGPTPRQKMQPYVLLPPRTIGQQLCSLCDLSCNLRPSRST